MVKPQTKVKKKGGAAVRVSVSLDAHDYADLKGIAEKGRVSVAWVVRDAVASYLNSRTPLFAPKGVDERP